MMTELFSPQGLSIKAVAAPLRTQVLDMLRSAIAEGVFVPRQRLIERDLCERLGVSRTSLRESLRDLEADGLVESIPNKGIIVTPLTEKSVIELFEALAALKSFVAGRFAQHASAAQKHLLLQAVDALANSIEKKGSERGQAYQAKTYFYDALSRGAQHDVAAHMLNHLRLRSSQAWRISLEAKGRKKQSVAELKAVVAACTSGTPAAARAAANLLCKNGCDAALSVLRGLPARD